MLRAAACAEQGDSHHLCSRAVAVNSSGTAGSRGSTGI